MAMVSHEFSYQDRLAKAVAGQESSKPKLAGQGYG